MTAIERKLEVSNCAHLSGDTYRVFFNPLRDGKRFVDVDAFDAKDAIQRAKGEKAISILMEQNNDKS